MRCFSIRFCQSKDLRCSTHIEALARRFLRLAWPLRLRAEQGFYGGTLRGRAAFFTWTANFPLQPFEIVSQ